MQITFAVPVEPGAAPLTFTANPNMPPYFNGQPYPPTSIGTPGGGAGAPYTFTGIGLPQGLALSVDGVLSGTPVNLSGTVMITGTLKDANG
jgi:hypothetical protein